MVKSKKPKVCCVNKSFFIQDIGNVIVLLYLLGKIKYVFILYFSCVRNTLDCVCVPKIRIPLFLLGLKSKRLSCNRVGKRIQGRGGGEKVVR